MSNNKTPAVVIKTKFYEADNSNWKIGKGDILDYFEKPEKFVPKINADHAVKSKSSKDFQDYMDNPEKSLGVFNDMTDKFTDNDKERFRSFERKSKESGCPKYIFVLSFDNDYLKENGYMDSSGVLNHEKMRNVARQSIHALVDASHKLDSDNCDYCACIHLNTDNIHIHYALLEKEMREDRKVTKKGSKQNCIEQEALRKAKAKAIQIIGQNNIRDRNKKLYELRQQVLLPQLSTAYNYSMKDIYNLASILPSDKQWQYNRKRMERYRKPINDCIDSIIRSDKKLLSAWQLYNSELNNMQKYYERAYGGEDMVDYKLYKSNQLEDFYARAGNSLLNYIKSADFKVTSSNNNDNDDVLSELPNIPIEIDNSDDNSSEEIDVEENATESAHLSEKKISSHYIKWSKMYNLANKYFYGGDNVDVDIEKAKALFLSEHSQGNLLATCMLGKLYANSGDEKLSQQYYAEAYNGFSEMLTANTDKWQKQYINYKLGTMSQHGSGVEQDYTAAANYYRAANDYPTALFNLGRLYQRGLGVGKSDKDAFECFERAYVLDKKKGLPHNTFALAQCYELGKATSKDNSKAQMLYKEALNAFMLSVKTTPDENVLYRIGYMFYYGKGTDINFEEAEKYFKRSYDYGNINACYFLGKLYKDKGDLQNAEKYFLLSAKDNNENAQYELGKMYLDQGNTSKALHWLHRSAEEHDNAYAQYALGKIYLAEENYNELKAEKYLLKSALQENEYAQYALGKLYLEQGHTPEALQWLHKSADEHNNQYAQCKLGTIYISRQNYNTIYDLNKSKYYLTCSAAQGNAYAALRLKNFGLSFGQKGQRQGNRLHYDINKAAADIRKAQSIADSLYSDAMSHLAMLQREFEQANNIIRT